jgi:hypothetical protein
MSGYLISELEKLLDLCGKIYNDNSYMETIGIFIELLQGYPVEDVKAAFKEHIRTSGRMPRPSDIITFLEGGSGEDKARKIWPLALKMAGKYYYNDQITLLPDGAAAVAVKTMLDFDINEVKYQFQTFKVSYEQARFKGLDKQPGTLLIDRTDKVYAGIFPRVKVIYTKWWPSEIIEKHKAAYEAFYGPVNPALLTCGGPPAGGLEMLPEMMLPCTQDVEIIAPQAKSQPAALMFTPKERINELSTTTPQKGRGL